MRICIDSCVFIRGLDMSTSDAGALLSLISPALQVAIPRLVVSEVTRNLHTSADINRFFGLFHNRPFAQIVEEPIPEQLVQSYIALGLRAKGDAYIGAFAEWQHVDCLISDNRHFLRQLRTDVYRLLSPAEFLRLLDMPTN